MLEFSLVLFEIRKPFRVVGSDGLPAAPTLELRGEALDPRGMVAARTSFRTEPRVLHLHGIFRIRCKVEVAEHPECKGSVNEQLRSSCDSAISPLPVFESRSIDRAALSEPAALLAPYRHLEAQTAQVKKQRPPPGVGDGRLMKPMKLSRPW